IFILITICIKIFYNVNISFLYYLFISFFSLLDFFYNSNFDILLYLFLLFNFFSIYIGCSEILIEKKVLGIESSWIYLFFNFFANQVFDSYNLLFFYINIEASTLCLFLLLTLKFDQISIEGSIKYLLMSSVSSA